ncbi:MAG: DUF2971 domain-containing protein [Deltaproteobacteria bacterium]|nr:DUF2971 domain-containing protein [Deltaproteobacteria bacterium]
MVQDAGRKRGVFCVSKTKESVSMWAHYASNHRGVIIEFDHGALVDEEHQVRSFKVNYQDSLPNLCQYRAAVESGDPVEFSKLFFCTKSTEWKNEQEWRFFTEPADSFLDLPEGSITRVILGAKMPDMTKNLIRQWIRSSDQKIILSNAYPSKYSFKIIAKDRLGD